MICIKIILPSTLSNEQTGIGEEFFSLSGDAELFNLDVHGSFHLDQRSSGLEGLGNGEVLVQLAVTLSALLSDLVNFWQKKNSCKIQQTE